MGTDLQTLKHATIIDLKKCEGPCTGFPPGLHPSTDSDRLANLHVRRDLRNGMPGIYNFQLPHQAFTTAFAAQDGLDCHPAVRF